MNREKVIVIGSGPAGLTAALYTARARLAPLVLVGDILGGQISLTYEVENYPGFPEALTGAELVERMQRQAERFGARLEYDSVIAVDFTHGSPFYVKTTSQEYETDAVIVAVGASPRKLHVPGEAEFTGRGVSYCATCDGFFFRDKDVVVVGGGDSALEEAIFLTRFAGKVTVVHRRDTLRAGPTLQQRALGNPKIDFLWDTVVEAIEGDSVVQRVRLRNVKTDGISAFKTDGVFIFIGHEPNGAVFQGQVAMDEHGYIVTDKWMHTSVEGVFAAGEIQDRVYRQIATSVGQGTAAAMSCERWLSSREA
jgi:thioredoxin reductase (NADPH)